LTDNVYEIFDKKRKLFEANQADEQDLDELKQLENKINKNKR